MEYVRCERCKRIIDLADGEEECPLCGNDLCGSDRVKERIYREYWKGAVGQPFSYNILKPNTPTTLIKKEGRE